MIELRLVETDTGDVLATVRGDHDAVTIEGEGAEIVESMLATRQRLKGISRFEALQWLQRIGWANGPLALIDPTRS